MTSEIHELCSPAVGVHVIFRDKICGIRLALADVVQSEIAEEASLIRCTAAAGEEYFTALCKICVDLCGKLGVKYNVIREYYQLVILEIAKTVNKIVKVLALKEYPVRTDILRSVLCKSTVGVYCAPMSLYVYSLNSPSGWS